MAGEKLVVYRQVSTREQGNSGLGLEAQQAATETYAKQTNGKIVGMYTEVESGKNDDRPELQRAIAHSKRSKAVLVISKLDRLARSVAFTSALMKSGVNFVCCDNPHANKVTIHIMAALAENEAEAISKRTKEALAAYKARGGKLGAHLPQCRGKLTLEARKKGARRAGAIAAKRANEAYTDLFDTVRNLKQEGLSLRAIADKLNGEGHTTRFGKIWNQVQVMRVLERAAAAVN